MHTLQTQKNTKQLRSFMLRVLLFVGMFVLPTSFALATVETFTTAVSTTWTAPANVYSVSVECWGGGAAGGAGEDTGTGAGGGGGGAYAKVQFVVTPGSSYNYTVGAGGVGTKTGTGPSGANSTFNTTSCVGAGGAGGAAVSAGGTGGAGGTIANSTGDTKYAGGAGSGYVSTTGGGGGGSGGSASNGTTATTATGASAVTDGGPGADGGISGNNGGDASLLSGPGGGGGGAGQQSGGGEYGGDGHDGQIRLTYITGYPVFGTLYSDRGSTTITTGKTVKLWVGTSTPSIHTTTSDGSGGYLFILPSSVADDTPLVLWVDGDATVKATAVSQFTFAPMSLVLYQSHTILRTQVATSTITIDDLALYDSSDDGDILYTANGTTDILTASSSSTFFVWKDSIFSAGGVGGALSFDDVLLQGTFTATSTQAISVSGSWDNAAGGTFNSDSSTVTLTADSGSNTLNGNFYNLTISGDDSFTAEGDLNITGDLTASAGSLIGSYDMTVQGDMGGDGAITFEDGTHLTNIAEVVAGGTHTCARTHSGALYCWGWNGYGQLGDGTSGTDRHTPVRVKDGEAVGNDTDGTYLVNVAGVISAANHTCARTNSGAMYCWGRNDEGKLGIHSITEQSETPVRVQDGVAVGTDDSDGTNLVNVAEMTANTLHTCARTNSGAMYCWGDNSVYGKLGDNQDSGTTYSSSPVRVHDGVAVGTDDSDGTYLTNIAEISASYWSTCARTHSGALYCWGAGGRLGDGTDTVSFTPVQVQDGTAAGGEDSDGTHLTNITEITAGYSQTCALSNSGAMYCWGSSANGQLGDDQDTTSRLAPVQVHDGVATGGEDSDGTYLTNIAEITTGSYYTCARTHSGALYCWGWNDYGQLGDSTSGTDRLTPVQVQDGVATGNDSTGSNLTNIKGIIAGTYHTCAHTHSGALYCWGRNTSGGLGDNTNGTDRLTPVQVEDGVATGDDTDNTNLTNIAEISAGYYHTCVRTHDGAVYCWGDVGSGKLGDDQSTTDRLTPVQVHDGTAVGEDSDGTYLTNIKEISTGDYHTCVLSNSGAVYCWGESANGRLGDDQSTTDRLTPVQVHDGTAVGEDSDGTYLTNIKEISAGNSHTCALSNSGAMYCWGGSANGQLGDVDLNATDRLTPVQVQDGTATGGEDSDGTYLTNIKEISAGHSHTCALSNSGAMYCWGDAYYGQLGDNQDTDDRLTPAQVHDGTATTTGDTDGTYLTNIKGITASWYHTCALSNSGVVYCWGDVGSGKLGDDQSTTDRLTPVQVHDGTAVGEDSDGTYLTNIKEISAGNSHTCALSNSGAMYCWGGSANGQLGDNQSTTSRYAPVQVHDGTATEGEDSDGTHLSNIKGITTGWYHSCALSNSGAVYCWGESANGRLGDDQSTTDRLTPVTTLRGMSNENQLDIDRPVVAIYGSDEFGGATDWQFVDLVFGDGHTTNTTNLTGTGLVSASGTLMVKANHTASTTQDISLGGDYLNLGTFIHDGTEFTVTGTTTDHTLTGTMTGTSAFNNVIVNSTAVSTFVDNASTSDFTILAGTTTAPTLFSIAGDYTNNATAVFSTTHILTFNGTTAQTLSGTIVGDNAFPNVTFTGAGTKTFNVSASTSDFTIDTTSGAVTAPSTALTIAGNYQNNGTFTHNSGEIFFDTPDSNGTPATDWGDGNSGSIDISHNGTTEDDAYAIALGPGGEIYVAGYYYDLSNADDDWRIRKYDANGDLATDWGDSNSGSIDVSNNGNDAAKDIALGPGGEIYVVGHYYNPSNVDNDWLIQKYDASGVLTTDWGDSNSGSVSVSSTGGNEAARAIALSSSGEIYVAGYYYNSGSSVDDWRIQKYDASGVLTTDWGDGNSGTIDITNATGTDLANAIALDGSGAIYVAGRYTNSISGYWDWRIRKYDANGDPDTTWGTSGSIDIPNNGDDSADAIALGSGGEIYVAGDYYNGDNSDWDWRIRKYDANGDLTTNWGDRNSGGINVSNDDGSDTAKAIALDSDGEIYVAGYYWSATNADEDWRIRKYDANGDLTIDWGDSDSGNIDISNNDGSDRAYAIALSSSEEVYAAGSYYNSTNGDDDWRIRKYGRDTRTISGTMVGSSAFADVSIGSEGTTSFSNNASTTDFIITSASTTVTAPAQLSIAGDYTNDGSTDLSATDVFFDGTTAQTIVDNSNTSFALNNVSFSGNSTKTLSNTYASTSNFTINSGATVIAPSTSLTIDGNYINSGSFTHNDGTIYITGSSASGTMTGASAFNDLIINPAGDGVTWATTTAVGDSDDWYGVAYGNGIFVAVANNGTNRVMTSSDGITWTARTAAGDNDLWNRVVFGNGMFVAVAGDSSDDMVMTSSDGITWATTTATGDNDDWQGVAYGNGLFVVVGLDTGDDVVMTSPDGITWTARTAAGDNDWWWSVTYGNGLFVAVGSSVVMTSPDGITWTLGSAAGNNDEWYTVTYGNGLFVAVGSGPDRVMTSPDGITWTARTAAGDDDSWSSVVYGNNQFVAVSNSGDRVMTSPDGITWTIQTAAGDDDGWLGITYGDDRFVAVGNTNDRVMISSFGTTTFQNNASTTNFIITESGDTVVAPALLSISGDYVNDGNFTHNSGEVTFDGITQQTATGTMSDTSAFNKLTLANTSQDGATTQGVVFGASISTGDTFTMQASTSAEFLAESTSTPTNISFDGTADSPIYLRSSVDDTQWGIETTGTQSVTYTDVQDSSACTGDDISAGDTSTDSGNNDCWLFGDVATIDSDANQTFSTDDSATTISPLTITDSAGTVLIKATTDIRIVIATTSVDMRFDTTLTTATFGGTASAKVSNPISYEQDGAILVIPVDTDFALSDTLTIEDLSFTDFNATNTPTTALSLRLDGSGDLTDEATDSKTVAIGGNLALGDATSGQVSDGLNAQRSNDMEAYAFKLTPTDESITVSSLALSLTLVDGINSTNLTNVRLVKDINSDGAFDGGDTAVGGTGAVSAITNRTGSITFSTPFTVPSIQDYLVVIDALDVKPTEAMTVSLTENNITSAGTDTAAPVTTTCSLIIKVRHRRSGGGGTSLGTPAPEGASLETGGTGDGGEMLGELPGCYKPTNTGTPHDEWTDGSNAYFSDGIKATSSTIGHRQSYRDFTFNIPSDNLVDGIELQIEASASTPAGTIDFALSWDGGTSITAVKSTSVLTTTDTIYTLGGSSDKWGRTWTPAELSDTNFRVRIIAQPDGNTVNIDAFQVHVNSVQGGGGGGGGSEVAIPSEQNYASVIMAGIALLSQLFEGVGSWFR